MVATTAENLGVFKYVRIVTGSVVLITSFFVLTAANAIAADWKLVPSINLTETYSDNVKLAVNGAEQSAYITQISPSFSVTASGQRLKLQANYVMQNSYYSGINNEAKTNHLLQANANASLIQDLFFLEGNANITQQNLSPFGQVVENNFNLSNNRAEVKTYSISPYFISKFNNNFTSELRYVHDSVVSGSLLSSNSQSDSLRFSLSSGSAFKTVNWGLNYSHQNVHYDNLAPLTTEMTTVSLGYQISPLFRLTSTSGYEKNSYVTLGEKPPGYFWTAGFAWAPTQRTNLIFNTGQRFYGKTHAMTFSHRGRMSVFSVGYNEDVTTTRGQFLIPATNNTSAFLNQLWQSTIPDATNRQQAVDNFIRDSGLPSALAQPINTFTNQVFLQRGMQGSIALSGVQNTIVFNLFNSTREPLSAGLEAAAISGPLSKDRQIGVNALWSWQLSPRTNTSVSATYTEAKIINTKDSTLNGVKNITKNLRASISRQLQPKLKATLEVRHVQTDSTLVFGNYHENAITLFLFLGF